MTIKIRHERFGRLVAIEPTKKRLRRSVVWRCRCDCGVMVEVETQSLTNGCKRSCGCIIATAMREAAARYRPAVRAYLQGRESLRVVANRFGLNFRKLHERVRRATA